METTAVQFRLFKGEVIAVFPYEIESSTNVMCYAHNGQHSGCVWDINNFSKAAAEAQYLPLKNELEQIGYNLKVIKKRSHKTYLKAFYNK
jgi:hypothetical protein